MADSLFNLQVKRIQARSTHHQQVDADWGATAAVAAVRISSQFYSISASFFLCSLLFCCFLHIFFHHHLLLHRRFCCCCCCGCNLNPQKWCQVFARVAFSKFKGSKWMVAGRDLGAVNGAEHGLSYADAPLMPNGSCFCPAVATWQKRLDNIWVVASGRKKKVCAAAVRSAHTNQRGTVGASWGEGFWREVRSGVRHVQHACTTDTRAHVPHLFDGNLHALDSHQRQTVSASVPLRPAHPTPPTPCSFPSTTNSACLSFS